MSSRWDTVARGVGDVCEFAVAHHDVGGMVHSGATGAVKLGVEPEHEAKASGFIWIYLQGGLLHVGGNELYRRGHPWVADHELRPKSVVRDMFERAMTFTEYVSFYGLARSEGLVLRYLADAYRALRQTVPEYARTEELSDLIEWLGELVRQVDSSLLDEWERLVNPEYDSGAPEVRPRGEDQVRGVTSNPRAFRVMVRNQLFRRVELAARRQWEALGALDAASGWDASAWEDALEPYFDEHGDIGIDAAARGPAMLMIDEVDGHWQVRQILDDPAGHHDWAINASIDLAASDEAGEPAVTITSVRSI